MINLSILIPTHNRATLLGDTIQSLAKIRNPGNVKIELVVVANACTDETVAVAENAFIELPFPARCIIEPTPGVCAARNCAIEHANYEWCAFLEDDIQVDEGWLQGILTPLAKAGADFVTGPVKLWWRDCPKPEWVDSRIEGLLSCRDLGSEMHPLSGPWLVMGGNMLFERNLVDRIGGFRSGLIIGEDTEFASRAFAEGVRAYYAPEALIWHYVPPTRLDPKYLCQRAYGRGYFGVLAKPAMGPLKWGRAFLGYGSIYLRGYATACLLYCCYDRLKATSAFTLAELGRGGMVALTKRLFSRHLPIQN
jgi:glycosyltransferase involved in cell wall biosynthesis